MDKFLLSYKTAKGLLDQFGSPLYVYDKEVLTKHGTELLNLLPDFDFHPSFSVKANSNIELLNIIGGMGFGVDVMSLGELHMALKANISKEHILFMCNNSSAEEMKIAKEHGVLLNVDSLMQLEQYCSLFPGSSITLRINTGIGDGHHEKVVTGGDNTKFGIHLSEVDEAIKITGENQVKIYGITHHIGSCFLESNHYITAAGELLNVATAIGGIQYINFGGGMGMPYEGEEARLDFEQLSGGLSQMIDRYADKLDLKHIKFGAQPGRYIVAEAGILLGTIHNIKRNGPVKYLGTDLGFNVLVRPMMYDSYHEIHVLSQCPSDQLEEVEVVGNICESGDILAHKRTLPYAQKGDIVLVSDTGAYGYSMSSNYNGRLRPAEVLQEKGAFREIRKRESYEMLLQQI